MEIRDQKLTPDSLAENAIFGFAANPNAKKLYQADKSGDTFFVLAQETNVLANLTPNETVDTAVSGYRNLSKKHFYDRAPHRCLKQVFRIVSRKIWRLKQTAYPKIQSSMMALILSKKFFWLGTNGDFMCFILRENNLLQIIPQDTHQIGAAEIFGLKKFIQPVTMEGEKGAGDIFILCSQNFISSLNKAQIQAILTSGLIRKISFRNLCETMIDQAAQKQKNPDYACMIFKG